MNESEITVFNKSEIALSRVSNELATAPEYKEMVKYINLKLPAIKKDSSNFYKADSQFKNVILDITELTPMGSLKHILAVLDQSRMALEEAHIALKRKQIQMKQKQEQYDKETDIYIQELIYVDIVELAVQISNSENYIKGAIRKMSFFTTQYESIMKKLGKEEITEEDYELNESRNHIMTAMKQALNAARTRGGFIDEGNYIYLFDMGINGAVAQSEIFAYLEMENDLIKNNLEPTHELTIKWLEACADKFANCGKLSAESRGLITLDEKSLVRELQNDKEGD
jgi:hypothetical protein